MSRLLIGRLVLLALVLQGVAPVGADMLPDPVEQHCAGHGFTNGSAARSERGSQVGLLHPEGYAIMQAVIARGVIGDFRAPDMLRFGFAPLYNRYVEVWDAVAVLKAVMDARAWDAPKFKARAAVT